VDIGNRKALRETYADAKAYVEATEREGHWEGNTYIPKPPERPFIQLLHDLTLGLTIGPNGGTVARLDQKDIDRIKLVYLKAGKISFEATYFPLFANIGMKLSDATDKWAKTVQRIEELCGAELKQREDDQRRLMAPINKQRKLGEWNSDGMLTLACLHGLSRQRWAEHMMNGNKTPVPCQQCGKTTDFKELWKAMGN
jgi:hypothetical protein